MDEIKEMQTAEFVESAQMAEAMVESLKMPSQRKMGLGLIASVMATATVAYFCKVDIEKLKTNIGEAYALVKEASELAGYPCYPLETFAHVQRTLKGAMT